MADLRHYRLIDGSGIKAIPMESLPPEAWNPIGKAAEESSLAKLVSSVAFMYRCVEVRAAAVNSVPWQIERRGNVMWTSDDVGDPPTAAADAWLAKFPRFMPRIEEALCVNSTAYLFKERNNARILGLRWLQSSSMTPVWGAEEIDYYKRTLGGGKPAIRLEPEDVVYVLLDGDSESEPKTSPALAAMLSAGVLHTVDEYVNNFVERGAIKPFIIGVPQGTPKSEREEVETFFNRFFSGMKNAFRAKAINADAMNTQQVGEGLENLTNSELTNERREDIATAMGVPHSLVLSNAANFATADADRLNFYDTTIIRECERIEWALNEQLFEPLGLHFAYMPQEMSLYQEDEEQRAAALESYVRAGVPLPVAVEILGVHLPNDMQPSDLAPEPEPEPVIVQAEPNEDEDRIAELERFKRWAKRRMGSKSFDVMGFESGILTSADRASVLAELREDASGDDAPFPVTSWEDYP